MRNGFLRHKFAMFLTPRDANARKIQDGRRGRRTCYRYVRRCRERELSSPPISWLPNSPDRERERERESWTFWIETRANRSFTFAMYPTWPLRLRIARIRAALPSPPLPSAPFSSLAACVPPALFCRSSCASCVSRFLRSSHACSSSSCFSRLPRSFPRF